MTCADYVTYYNSCKCCILGSLCTDKTKAHNEQLEGNCKNKNVVISNIQMQMTCDIPVLFRKWNSHANFIHITLDNKYPLPTLLTFCVNQSESCLPLSVTIYIEIHIIITYRNMAFNTTTWLCIFCLSRPFSTAIIRVSRQCLDMCRQHLEMSRYVSMSRQCLDVSRQC